MALDTETLQEIKTYMDERASIWRYEAKEVARETLSGELKSRDERHSKRLQLLSAVGGLTLAALIGIIYSAINNYAAAVAERTAKAKVDEVLGEDNRVVSFLERSMEAVIASQTAARVAQESAETALAESETARADALKSQKELDEQLENAQASIQNAELRLAELEAETISADDLLAETKLKRQELNALTSDIERVQKLADTLLREEGGINDIVSAALENSEILESVATSLTLPKGTVIALDNAQSQSPTCPIGWRPFSESQGRFILSANQDFLPGTIGGEETVTLTVDQMPELSLTGTGTLALPLLASIDSQNFARANTLSSAFGIDGRTTGFRYATGDAVSSGANTVQATTFRFSGSARDVETILNWPGANQPHNNIPPYIALYYCKKN